MIDDMELLMIVGVDELMGDRKVYWCVTLSNETRQNLLETAIPQHFLQQAQRMLKLDDDISRCLMHLTVRSAKNTVYRIYSTAVTLYLIWLIKDWEGRDALIIPRQMIQDELKAYFSIDPSDSTHRWNYYAVERCLDIFASIKPDLFRITLGPDDICISYYHIASECVYYVKISPLIQ